MYVFVYLWVRISFVVREPAMIAMQENKCNAQCFFGSTN